MGKLDPKKRRLNLVEPEVAADGRVVRLGGGTMDPQQSNPRREFVVVRHDHSTVPKSPQVFGREEGQRGGATAGTHPAPSRAGRRRRSDRLRGVLEERN